MRFKVLIILAFLSFLLCSLHWAQGTQGGSFGKLEYQILASGFRKDLLHPALFIPFAGQLLLLICLLMRAPGRKLVLTALTLPGMLVLFVLLINLLSRQWTDALSALPYTAIWLYMVFSRRKRESNLI